MNHLPKTAACISASSDDPSLLQWLQGLNNRRLPVFISLYGPNDRRQGELRTQFPCTSILSGQEPIDRTSALNCSILAALSTGCDYLLIRGDDTIEPPEGINWAVEFLDRHQEFGFVAFSLVGWLVVRSEIIQRTGVLPWDDGSTPDLCGWLFDIRRAGGEGGLVWTATTWWKFFLSRCLAKRYLNRVILFLLSNCIQYRIRKKKCYRLDAHFLFNRCFHLFLTCATRWNGLQLREGEKNDDFRKRSATPSETARPILRKVGVDPDVGQPWARLDRCPVKTAFYPANCRERSGNDFFYAIDDKEGYDKWCRARDKHAAQNYCPGEHESRLLFSVLVPVCDPQPQWLAECIASVKNQTHAEWELILSDDASENTAIKDILEAASADDARIHRIFNTCRGGISHATNRAAAAASGYYLLFLDHDDILDRFALSAFAKSIMEHKGEGPVDILYADEDFFDDAEKIRRLPSFKPDYSPDMLLATNYIHHPLMMRRGLFERLNGLRSAYDGSQDHDLLLRAEEHRPRIVHIPDVLHHMRIHSASLASGPKAKPQAHQRDREAIRQTLKRRGITGTVIPAPDGYPGQNLIRRPLTADPSLTVLIVPEGPVDTAKIARNWYPFSFLIGSPRRPVPQEINTLVARTDSEIVVVASSSIRPRDGWIDALIPHVMRSDIGMVSGKIVYCNNTLYSCGLVLGVGGAAARWHHGWPASFPGFCGWMALDHEVSAVPWRFFAIRRELFLESGLMETKFQSNGFDIDLALRISDNFHVRHLTVPTAKAVLETDQHRRPFEDWSVDDLALLWETWGPELRKGDPYLNPHYTLYKEGLWLSDEPEMRLRARGYFSAYDRLTAGLLRRRLQTR